MNFVSLALLGVRTWVPGGVLVCALAGCAQPPHTPRRDHDSLNASVPPGDPGALRLALPTLRDDQPRDYPGVHNAVAYHEGFVSGSVPEGEAGLATLAAMGVKTIISVDGAEPEVDRAAAYGMRYVHLPIGYNGFDDSRRLELARASRDALREGPVYIHCHHGKHRSAGAAAAVASSLGWMTPEEGVARMKVSGTAPNYAGLYACAAEASVVETSLIEAVSGDFPSTSKPSTFVQGMVEIDEVMEHLKLIEKAAWRVPADHPDLVPAAEAGRLADLYRALAVGEYARSKPAEFLVLIEQGRAEAQHLEDLLVQSSTDGPSLAAAFKAVGASCKTCHAAYRD